MATKLDICNGALTKLGVQHITRLDQGGKSADVCNLRYDNAREFVLRSHLWKCIKSRQLLNASTTVPAFQWQYQFKVPSNLLRLWLVVDTLGRPLRNYEFESGHILADVDTINIKYGRNEESTSIFDPMLRESISLYLAYDIGFSLTKNEKLVESVGAAYFTTLRFAKSVDSKEDYPKTVQSNKWNNARSINSSPPTRFPSLE